MTSSSHVDSEQTGLSCHPLSEKGNEYNGDVSPPHATKHEKTRTTDGGRFHIKQSEIQNHGTLKRILTTSFLLIATLPLLVTGFISLKIMSQRMEQEIFEKNQAIADAIAGEISRSLEEPLSILRQAREMMDSEAFILPSEQNRYLASILRSYPFFDRLKILNAQGIVTHIAPYDNDFVQIDLSNQHFFKLMEQNKRPIWSSPYISVKTGYPTLTLSYPLKNGLVVGNLTLSYLKNISDRVKIGSRGYATVVDKSGTVLAHPDTTHIAEQQNLKHLPVVAMGLKGKIKTLRYTFENIEWIGSVATVPQTGWLVSIFQPVEEALAPLYDIRKVIFLGTALSVYFAVLAALIIVKKTMAPLTLLLTSTMRIAQGDYIHPLKVNSYQEINTLSHSFNLMAEAILSREQALKRDMEKRKRLEEQLRQAHKMEAIGTLAGGIAHDFNNILAVILGYAEMAGLEARTHGFTTVIHPLDQILTAGARAKDLVKQILAFSRKEPQQRSPLEIHSQLKEALKFIRSSIPTTIEIRQQIRSDTGKILADPTQIHQVIMNICTNAAQAMEEKGGILSLFLSSIFDLTSDPDAAEMFTTSGEKSVVKPGPYVKLSISDTGTGIAPENISKIFDPYFTTKGVGEGTGMGLSVVMGIVKSHDGLIFVKSRPGEGSTFHIFFPKIETPLPKSTPSNQSHVFPKGNEKILVVDDQEDIIEVTRLHLERLGYDVTTRTKSPEALALFLSQPEAFDLVITDQTMPEMTGDELSSELKRIRPELPIILCSGYSAKIDEAEEQFSVIDAFIMKPVDVYELAVTIRNLLDAR